MSWSLSLSNVARADARASFQAAHEAQAAYAQDGAHKAVMDRIATFAADVVEAAPEGSVGSLSSSGHVGTDGLGSASVSVSFYRPVPPA